MKRSRQKRGFTLVETLIAVAVLAVFGAGAVAISTAALHSKNAREEAGLSQTVASTAIMTLADEIRYGQNVREQDGNIVLDSKTFGDGVGFVCADGRILAQSGSASTELLPDKFYGNLKVSKLELKKASEADSVSITVTVDGTRGEIYTATLTVKAQNGVAG